MNGRTERNVLQRKRISNENVGLRSRDDGHADLQPNWLQDIPVFAVGVAQESDERRPIRIVFDGFHPCRNTSLVAAEIDHAIVLLVSAAAMANGKLAVIVAAVDSILAVQKRLERLVGCDFRLVVDDRLKTKRVGLRLESFDSHYMFSPYSIIFSPSRSVTYAFFQSGR